MDRDSSPFGGQLPASMPLSVSNEQIKLLMDKALEFALKEKSSQAEPAGSAADADERSEALAVFQKVLESKFSDEGEKRFCQAFDSLFEIAQHGSKETAGYHFSHFPSGALFHGAIGALLGAALNRGLTFMMVSPGLAAVEESCVRWVAKSLVGYPEGCGGVFATGGSMSNLLAVFTARRSKVPEEELLRAVVYICNGKNSIEHAASMCGIMSRNVKTVASPAELDAAVARDKEKGLLPFLIVATAGNTSFGTVDPLDQFADVAEKHGMWMHVDAVYGGFFLLTEEGRQLLKGIERSDSASFDPHKSFMLPYGVGMLVVKSQQKLKSANEMDAPYLPPNQNALTVPDDIQHLSFELTRETRGIQMWLPLKMLGVAPFRQHLQMMLDWGEWLQQQVDGHFHLVAQRHLSVLTFRMVPPGMSAEDVDALNIRLMTEINGLKHVTVSSLSSPVVWVRACLLSCRIEFQRVENLRDDILLSAERLAAELPK